MENEIPTLAGSEESLEERIKRLEKEKSGVIRDLQGERSERQALEKRIREIEDIQVRNQPEDSPEKLVQQLANDPNNFIFDRINQVVEERVTPLVERLTMKEIDDRLNDAFEEIAEREGIGKRQARKKYEEKLSVLVKDREFNKLDPYSGTISAYELMLQEEKQKEAREKERQAQINGNSSERVGVSRPNGTRSFTRAEIAKMSPEEFNQNYPAIKEAERNGLIT